MNLRPAALSDLEVLRHWDQQPHVIASDPNDDWNWKVELQRFPEWREQLIAEIDETPIGFIQIIDPLNEESGYWGNVEPHLRAVDIWIGESHNLNKGFGTSMMKLALERCFKDPMVKAVFVDPLATNTGAHRFYKRLGFQFVEQRAFGNDDCFVFRLTRKAFERNKRDCPRNPTR